MKRGYLKLNKKIVTKEELKNSQLMTIPDINYLYCDYCGSYNRAIKSDEHAFKILNPILDTLRHVDVSRNKEI